MPARRSLLAALCIGATSTAAAAPVRAAPPQLLPDDLAFLETALIDDLVTDAENGSADCAALEIVLGIGLIAAFAAAEPPVETGDSETTVETEPSISGEAFWAVSAPMLVPLLDRASTDDEVAARFVEEVGNELVGAIYEMRELGITDDDLLVIQESFAFEMDVEAGVVTSAPGEDDLAGLETRIQAVMGHDFDAITFLDGDADEASGVPGIEVPWEASCPETVGILDVNIEATVEATADFEIVVTIP